MKPIEEVVNGILWPFLAVLAVLMLAAVLGAL